MNTPFVEIHSLDKSPLCTLYTLSVKLNGSAAIEIVSTKAIPRQNDNTSIVFAFAWRASSNPTFQVEVGLIREYTMPAIYRPGYEWRQSYKCLSYYTSFFNSLTLDKDFERTRFEQLFNRTNLSVSEIF